MLSKKKRSLLLKNENMTWLIDSYFHQWYPGSNLVWIVRNIYYFVFFFTTWTWNGMNSWLRQFLNKNDIKISVSFQNYIGKKLILLNILQKKLDVFNNHTWLPLMVEQIDCFLISLSSWYFLVYHFLLKWYL